ncbi:MAG: hypothetical protein WBD36_03090 [Bacteroidota bacterium]
MKSFLTPPPPVALKGPALSASPTPQELADLFTSGEISKSEVIERAVEKGGSAVEGLRELLFSQTLRGSQLEYPDSGGLPPNRIFAVLTLEKIGTAAAFEVLTETAKSHSNPEIRGLSIQAISKTCYQHVRKGEFEPNKSVVEALIQNLDSPTFIAAAQRPIGQIAQEGLVRWLGLDFGDPEFSEARKTSGGQTEMSAAEYARQWWERNADKVVWNGARKHLEVQK